MDVSQINYVFGLDPKKYSRSPLLEELRDIKQKYQSSSDQEIFDSAIFKRFFAIPIPSDPKVRHFSLFVDQDLETSDRLIKQFYKLSTQSELLQLAIDRISNNNNHPLLVKYSLAVAINHAPQFQRLKCQVPQALVIAPSHVFVDKNVPKRWKNPDALLKWWREDPMLNSHHWNWHSAYPSFGVSLDDSPAKLKDRQGELFVYMHRQLVARYDCERTAFGLQPIDPFGSNSYRESLGDAYDPLITSFVPRPEDSKIRDNVSGTPPFDSISVFDLEIWRDRLFEAIQNRTFKKQVINPDGTVGVKEIPMTIADLGSSLEATMGSPNKAIYGNLNKQFHNLLSRVYRQGDEQTTIGIMGDIIGAFRDPMFWRWHKHLDEFFHRFEMTLAPHNLKEAAPTGVTVSKAVVKQRFTAVAVTNRETGQPDVVLRPANESKLYDNHLTTYMKTQVISIKSDGSVVSATPGHQNNPDVLNTYVTNRLYYIPFNYEISVVNEDQQFKSVVVRIYIVANEDYGDRRKWISMDQFFTSIPAGQKNYVITRSSSDSTILQQAATEEWPGNWEGLESMPPIVNDTYCKCGLPRNLLLPRGTKEGMGFKMCVIVTDAKNDVITYSDGSSSCCDGNIYCGTYNKPYPFKMDMGYPFNRVIPTQADTLEEKMDLYLQEPNIFKTDINIKWDIPKVSAA
eukprot:gene1278-1610_t